MKRIAKEYKILKEHTTKTEYSDDCCDTHYSYRLPCRHLLLKRMKEREENPPYIQIDDFDPRWLHNYDVNVIQTKANTVSLRATTTIKDNDWSYTACIDRLEKYFTNAKRSESIQKVFMEALEKLENLEHESGDASFIRPPNSLLIPGAPGRHPRNNVDRAGACRTKKVYKTET